MMSSFQNGGCCCRMSIWPQCKLFNWEMLPIVKGKGVSGYAGCYMVDVCGCWSGVKGVCGCSCICDLKLVDGENVTSFWKFWKPTGSTPDSVFYTQYMYCARVCSIEWQNVCWQMLYKHWHNRYIGFNDYCFIFNCNIPNSPVHTQHHHLPCIVARVANLCHCVL